MSSILPSVSEESGLAAALDGLALVRRSRLLSGTSIADPNAAFEHGDPLSTAPWNRWLRAADQCR
jgi:hypothetical protein